MIKKYILPAVITSSIIGLVGCSNEGESVEKANTTPSVETQTQTETTSPKSEKKEKIQRTIVDHFGNEVQLPEKIEKIAIVQLLPLPSVYAVYNGGDISSLVGMPPSSLNAAENSILKKFVPEIVDVTSDFIKDNKVNIEELLNLNPDVVLYSGAGNTDIFKEAGLTAVGFIPGFEGPNTIEDVGNWIQLLEDVFQQDSKTTGIVEYGRDLEKLVAERVNNLPDKERKKIMIINSYNETALAVAGKGTFGEYWTNAIGAINVAMDASGNTINMEQVYEWAPDKIFISTLTDVMPHNLYENTAPTGHNWSSVAAVKNKEVYKYPLGIHRWYPTSTDAPLSLLWLAKNTYPELFEDIDLNTTIKEYYKEFYNMNLTDEDVDWILTPAENLGFK
ncbi:ABC transporter substrate-binding protein [Cytobacillus praedii]|uniref:ABC transporter substrate-binding protein n=1 Tax=Cytobacillus praedii TaxID=1742358 RepID=UPI002E1B7A1B|nr:ABC transporter substrate-binding protein [Cytobacillus praedii]